MMLSCILNVWALARYHAKAGVIFWYIRRISSYDKSRDSPGAPRGPRQNLPMLVLSGVDEGYDPVDLNLRSLRRLVPRQWIVRDKRFNSLSVEPMIICSPRAGGLRLKSSLKFRGREEVVARLYQEGDAVPCPPIDPPKSSLLSTRPCPR